jgi:hypothetical protein
MESRRLVVGLVGVNLILVAVLLIQNHRVSAAADSGTIRTRALEVVDERGRVRAQLNVEADGEAVFRLRDSEGQVRVKLGAAGDGSGLLLLDGSTEPGIHMVVKGSGSTLTLTSRGGQRRVITP